MARQAEAPRDLQRILRILAGDVEHRGLRRFRSGVDEVHDHALVLADYSGVWLDYDIADRRGAPVIAARHPAPIVQALLDDGPLAVRRDDETVKVNLKAIGDRVVVDARGEPASAYQSFAVEAATLRDIEQFLRRVAREPSAAAADVDSEFIRPWGEAALQRSHDGCSDARRVPVHSHHGAERLEPERVAETREESRSAVIPNDGFGDRRAEFGHPFGEPLRDVAAVQGKVCESGAFHVVIICLTPLL